MVIPADQRALLGAVRDQINRQVPGVGETISYNMKGSLHFTTERPIPPDVLEALIQDRVTDHEASGY